MRCASRAGNGDYGLIAGWYCTLQYVINLLIYWSVPGSSFGCAGNPDQVFEYKQSHYNEEIDVEIVIEGNAFYHLIKPYQRKSFAACENAIERRINESGSAHVRRKERG
jgi:hypothetical protein